jgi:hypothetical protein
VSTTLFAAALLIIASLAFVAVGAVYKWDVTAPGYARWTRVVGAMAVLGLAAVAAWDRIDTPLVSGLAPRDRP